MRTPHERIHQDATQACSADRDPQQGDRTASISLMNSQSDVPATRAPCPLWHTVPLTGDSLEFLVRQSEVATSVLAPVIRRSETYAVLLNNVF